MKKQTSLSGQLIELGYQGSTFNYFEIKEWLWDKHRMGITACVYDTTLEQYGYIAWERKNRKEKTVCQDNEQDIILSPITAEKEGIKHVVRYLYSLILNEGKATNK